MLHRKYILLVCHHQEKKQLIKQNLNTIEDLEKHFNLYYK